MMTRARSLLLALAPGLLLGAPAAEPASPASAAAAVSASVSAAPSAASAPVRPTSLQRVADAITEIDLAAAERGLASEPEDAPGTRFERARLAIYRGDCDGALAILKGLGASSEPGVVLLLDLSERCAGATAHGTVVESQADGVWIRLQDEADRPFVPLLLDVARRARAAIEADLGVDLPRPLRIDLVRDLFSLAAVSGLPLESAETTGAVAVARWGRVTMVSPHAIPHGFPWQDTLAHEITHLVVSRGTRDRAPLWLQEGLAKRTESRWRSPRPFDDPRAHDAVSRRALHDGRAVPIDALGPSIAMLPSADVAATAFAEVTSFVNFWIDRRGKPALRQLFLDLRGTSDDDAAMRSVTGLTVAQAIGEWEIWVRGIEDPPGKSGGYPLSRLARAARLGDLLAARGHPRVAAAVLEPAIASAPSEGTLRARAARWKVAAGDDAGALVALGELSALSAPAAAWYALHGRLRPAPDPAQQKNQFELGIALDPLEEVVACEGLEGAAGDAPDLPPLPRDSAAADLCRAARAHTRHPP